MFVEKKQAYLVKGKKGKKTKYLTYNNETRYSKGYLSLTDKEWAKYYHTKEDAFTELSRYIDKTKTAKWEDFEILSVEIRELTTPFKTGLDILPTRIELFPKIYEEYRPETFGYVTKNFVTEDWIYSKLRKQYNAAASSFKFEIINGDTSKEDYERKRDCYTIKGETKVVISNIIWGGTAK